MNSEQLLNPDHSFWSTGSSGYFSDIEYNNFPLLVAIQFSLGSNPATSIGLLDTASRWVVLPKDFLEDLGIPFIEDPLMADTMSTRLGLIKGFLDRLQLVIIAENGNSLALESTCFIAEDWQGPPVIGWKGCLERIRFALDPSVNRLYFGPY